MDNYVDKIRKGGNLYDFRDTTSGYAKTAEDIGLEKVDNTTDAEKKTAFTGSIAQGDDGFVTGDAVYEVLGNVEALLAAL